MRRLLPLLPLILGVVGCASTAPYSSEDLQQVHLAYKLIAPDYHQFKHAYKTGNGAALWKIYVKERKDCRIEDAVDRRDTIDPNIKLFQASSFIDSFCNDMDGAWAYWQWRHHGKYDKNILPPGDTDIWLDGDLDAKEIPVLLRHPNDLA